MRISSLLLAPAAALLAPSLPKSATVLTAEPPSRWARHQKKYGRGSGAAVAEAPTVPDATDFSYDDFASELGTLSYDFARGASVMGTVVQYEYRGALVDIGAKAAAFLPLRECSLMPIDDISAAVTLDENREFQIVSDENENGQLTVSIRRIEFQKAWGKVLELQAEDAVFEAEVITVNRGGAIVMIEGLRGFLPGSHLCGVLPTLELVGTKLPIKFLEVDQEANKLVVSNRRAVVEQQMRDIARGSVVSGIVKAIKPYGAFVEIGGMSGLLHISQISYDRIEDLGAVLKPGMAVKCMIIDHDKVNGRIALSTKALEGEPGDMLKDAASVFANAEETAKKYHERMDQERKAREEAAREIVMGLGEGIDGETFDDPLGSVGLEEVLPIGEAK